MVLAMALEVLPKKGRVMLPLVFPSLLFDGVVLFLVLVAVTQDDLV